MDIKLSQTEMASVISVIGTYDPNTVYDPNNGKLYSPKFPFDAVILTLLNPLLWFLVLKTNNFYF